MGIHTHLSPSGDAAHCEPHEDTRRLRARCKRCSRPNEWLDFAHNMPEQAKSDAPFVFAGYCSGICQALDLRDSLVENGLFDPLTNEVSISDIDGDDYNKVVEARGLLLGIVRR